MLVGFFLLRFMGQGSMCLVSQTVINLWWVKKRGVIQGLAGSCSSIIMSWVVPQAMLSLMDAFDWRVTYVILGAFTVAVMTPIGWLTFR